MTKFTVVIQQYVQEVASIEVEAETPEAAAAKVKKMIDDETEEIDFADWEDGDDVLDEPEVCEVKNPEGRAVFWPSR
jgi:hypothetical protein